MKSAVAFTILFFCFIFGLPMMSMLNTAQIITGQDDVELVLEEMEKKKARLTTEHKIQVEKNKKALHDGTYKAKPWKGFQLPTE